MKRLSLSVIAVAWAMSLLLLTWDNRSVGVWLSWLLFATGFAGIIKLWRGDKHTPDWQNLAQRDELTGLLNRRGLHAGTPPAPYCVLVFDIDYFKAINDTHGHSVGDAVLKHFADALTNNTRRGDLCSRFGGDEFIVILTAIDKQAAQAFTARLFQCLAVSHALPRYTVSVGAADTTQAQSLDELIKLADSDLLRHKGRKVA